MELSKPAQAKRQNDMFTVCRNASTINLITITAIGTLLLLRHYMAEKKLTPLQRAALYTLLVLAAGGLIVIAQKQPAVAIIVGFILGVLATQIHRI